jgi:hypothetical protein
MKEIIYIEDSKQFLIDGKTVNESSLSVEEANNLKRLAESQQLLVGTVSSDINNDERFLV